MGIDVKARTFNSLINILRILALPHMFLTFIHLLQSLQFISSHKEINELLGHNKVRLLPSTFSALDLFICFSSLMNFFLKGKLNHCQYLTDTENCLYGFVVIVSFLCSTGYLLFSVDILFRDHVTAEIFRQKMQSAMRVYPLGAAKPLVDLIQSKYSCCGADKATDWFDFDWYSRKGNFTNDDVPFSCCSNALHIPCIHLNLKRNTYYVKYNSSVPTIWTCGCVVRFSDMYLVDYEWLIYFGIVISLFSMCTSVLDRLLQTADNTFCYKKIFRLGLFTSDPPWKKLVSIWRQREELEHARSDKGSNVRCIRSSGSIFSLFSRYRNRNKTSCKKCKPTPRARCTCSCLSHRSYPSNCNNPTVMPLLSSPDEGAQVRMRFSSSILSAESGSVINEQSTTFSHSGRKRKSEESFPSVEKRLKKLN